MNTDNRASVVTGDLSDAPQDGPSHFRARFYQSSLPQSITDLHLRVTMVNGAMTDLLGRTAEQIIGRHVDELAHGDDRSSRARELLQVPSPGSLEYERLYRRPDGSAVPVRVIATLVRDDRGVPQSVAAFVLDLSAQKAAEEALRRRETLFQSLLERASDIAVVNAPDGRVIYANTTVALFGYRPEEVLGKAGFDFVHPEHRASVVDAFERIQQHPGEPATLVYRHSHAGGGFRWVESSISNRLNDPDIGGIVINLRDVTARVEATRALQESEERYRAIVETAQEGIWVANPEGRTLYVNQKMADIVGRSADELHSRTVLDLLDRHEAASMAQRLQDRRALGVEEYELRYPHPDGDTRWLRVRSSPLFDSEEAFIGSLGMVSDATELKRVEEALRKQALYDAVTGLPNRTLLQDRLEQAVDRRTRGLASGVTAMFLDVDQFKLVNDSLGHAAGDQLLTELADRLEGAAGPGDTVARFGGDEFVVLSEDLTVMQAADLADRIHAQLDEPFDIGSRAVHVTASIGIAASPDCPSDELLQSADAAMFVAKHRGRGLVEVFDDTLAAQTRDRLDLSVDLRRALDEDLLQLHYQPIIDLGSGRLLGLEALLRWNHPKRGAVSPELFVSIAEQSGFVPRLDCWVLRTATRDLAELRADGHVHDDVYVSVNVSAVHLTHGNLERAVNEALSASQLPPRCLGLELTETAVMTDPDSASALLNRLVGFGVSIALDDFGTGYSSLAYLRKLPVARLKIDRTFVEHLARSADDLAIVASVVDLSRAVGLHAVAEGVEKTEQLDVLARLGCHAGQGYLWSRPIPKTELVGLLSPDEGPSFDVRTVHQKDALVRPPSAARATREHGLNKLLHLHQSGASLRSIAAALNAEGYRTPVGSRWHPTSVAAVIADHAYPALWTRS